jgi:aryl-alcohol dehydrogenase-like predicted oxidoreductase
VPPAAEQPQYNLVFRKNVEIELPGVCTDTGIGLTTTSPLCSGVLTGKYNDHFPSDTRVSLKDLGWMKEALDGQEGRAVVEQVRRLTGVARALQISVAQLAVAWCLKNPHVSSVILGASTVPQLTENLASIECTDRLTPEIMAEIDRVMEYAEQPADAVPS